MRFQMKRIVLALLGSGLLVSTGCSAADHDFNSVVSAVEHKYSVHAQRIPMMTLVSICASLKTHGGVRSLRVAEFDNLRGMDGKDLYPLLRSRLGDEWQPFVTEVSGGAKSRWGSVCDSSASRRFVDGHDDCGLRPRRIGSGRNGDERRCIIQVAA